MVVNNIYIGYIANIYEGKNMRKLFVNITDLQNEHLSVVKQKYGMTKTSQIQQMIKTDMEKYEFPQQQGVSIYNQSVGTQHIKRAVPIQRSPMKSVNDEFKELLKSRKIKVAE